MSWLFDRLTDLAVADHLTIVIDTPPNCVDDELGRMLRRAQSLAATSVCAHPDALTDGATSSVGATFVASGTLAGPALFRALGEHDLAVSIGGTAPGATMQVDAIADLSSLLDALITLRSYAQRAVA